MRIWNKGLVCVSVLASGVLAAGAFPLKVDIDVSTKRTRQQIGAGVSGEARVEDVSLKVKIRRSGGDIPEGMLHAELYVIGTKVHTGDYVIIDVQKGDFELSRDNNYEFVYESPTYSLGATSGNIKAGAKYETFLVVVSDPAGAMIDWRSGRALREEGVALIREMGPRTLFDKDGNVLGEVENPGEAFKAAVPAAVDPGGGDRAISPY